jgi:hypothetical protein
VWCSHVACTPPHATSDCEHTLKRDTRRSTHGGIALGHALTLALLGGHLLLLRLHVFRLLLLLLVSPGSVCGSLVVSGESWADVVDVTASERQQRRCASIRPGCSIMGVPRPRDWSGFSTEVSNGDSQQGPMRSPHATSTTPATRE